MRTRHVGLRVADIRRSVAFYTSIGNEVCGDVPATEPGTLTMLKLPGDELVTLELVHDPNDGPVEPGGLSHRMIQVDDVHVTAARLVARGSKPKSPDLLTATRTSGRHG